MEKINQEQNERKTRVVRQNAFSLHPALVKSSPSAPSTGKITIEADNDDWSDFAEPIALMANAGDHINRRFGKEAQPNLSFKDNEFDYDELDIDNDDENGNDLVQKDMSEDVMKLISKLQLSSTEEVILEASYQLIAIFKENPSQQYRLIRNIGVIPFIEMLDNSNPRIIFSILQVVNQVLSFLFTIHSLMHKH